MMKEISIPKLVELMESDDSLEFMGYRDGKNFYRTRVGAADEESGFFTVYVVG